MIAYGYHKKHYPGSKCPAEIITPITKLKSLSATMT